MIRLFQVLALLLIGLCGQAQTLPKQSAGPVEASDFGALGDGVADDTSPIQEAINQANGRGVHLRAGTYAIRGILVGAGALRLAGDGMGRTVLKKTGDKGHLLDLVGTMRKFHVQISDLTFDSNGSDSGLWGEYLDDLQVLRCEFKNHPYWGIAIGVRQGQDPVIRNHQILIEDCSFIQSNQTYEHLLIFNTKDVRVRRCTFESSPKGIGIGLYQNVEDVVIETCRFTGLKTASYYSLSCNRIQFIGCQIDNTLVGIQGANLSDNGAFGATQVHNLNVINCSFTNNKDCGLNVGGVDQGLIAGCTFKENRSTGLLINNGGISVRAMTENITIRQCTFKNNNAADGPSMHSPGVAFNGPTGAKSITFMNCKFLDDRLKSRQLYSVVFGGKAIWESIYFIACQLSAYSGAYSIGTQDGALPAHCRIIDCCQATSETDPLASRKLTPLL